MLREERFAMDMPLTGMEVELNLIDEQGWPALINSEVLASIDNPAFVQELGRFNLEINVPPQSLLGDGAARYEDQVRTQLNAAEERAQAEGAGIMMIGILPTLRPELLTHEAISTNSRYALLDSRCCWRAARTCTSTSAARTSRWTPSRTPSPRRPPARASSSTCRSAPTSSPHTGTPPSAWPRHRSRWARTRRTSSAASSGARPASRCSPRPPTLGPSR